MRASGVPTNRPQPSSVASRIDPKPVVVPPPSFLLGLECHLCKAMFPAEATYVCDKCLGPLEPVYEYSAIRLTHQQIESRPKNLWRYRELLPITGEPLTG